MGIAPQGAAAGTAVSAAGQGVAGGSGQVSQDALRVIKVEGADKTYPRQKIVYIAECNKKKSEMGEEDKKKEIRWAVKAGNSVPMKLECIGEKITLDIEPGWEYKDILVMAYIDSHSETVSQKTKVLDDPYGSTLIRGVVGEDEASAGQDVEYSVTNSNKDGRAGEVSDGSDVKWAIKVGKDGVIDKAMLSGMRGKKAIVLRMRKEWAGKEITVMPYMNSPTETVSVRTRVGKQEIKEIYWSYGKDCIRVSGKSRFYADLNLHVKTENYKDGDMVSITLKRKDGQPLFGDTQKLNLKGTVSDNEAIFENVFKEYTLNMNDTGRK
jgi:hypothetical protein